jgi:hypothetical protein
VCDGPDGAPHQLADTVDRLRRWQAASSAGKLPAQRSGGDYLRLVETSANEFQLQSRDGRVVGHLAQDGPSGESNGSFTAGPATCDLCERAEAESFCRDCEMLFCQKCSVKLHAKGNHQGSQQATRKQLC